MHLLGTVFQLDLCLLRWNVSPKFSLVTRLIYFTIQSDVQTWEELPLFFHLVGQQTELKGKCVWK